MSKTMSKTMSKILAVFLLMAVANTAFSQVKVGDNPTAIDDGSVLEVESTTQGFVPPRMTTLQMNAIATPLVGSVVFNTDQDCLYQFKAVGGWSSICDDPGNALVVQKSVDQNTSGDSFTIDRVTFDPAPVVTAGSAITWNGSDAFTINQTGIYTITAQVGFATSAGSDRVIGVINSSNLWVGRATWSQQAGGANTSSGRNYNTYTTTLSLTAGDVLGIGANSSGTVAAIQGNQTGGTGTGNVTSFTVVKIL